MNKIHIAALSVAVLLAYPFVSSVAGEKSIYTPDNVSEAVAFNGVSAADAPATAVEEQILGKIEKANAKVSTLTSDFTRTKLIKASGRTTTAKGRLSYKAADKLLMDYSNPAGDILIINGGKMQMRLGAQKGTFDLGKNKLMGSLSVTLLGCIAGKAQSVADANNANITAKEVSGNYMVTLAAREKATRGYSIIKLTYRKSDCILTEMVMTEFTGISTTYTMSGIKSGETVSDDVFKISGKSAAGNSKPVKATASAK